MHLVHPQTATISSNSRRYETHHASDIGHLFVADSMYKRFQTGQVTAPTWPLSARANRVRLEYEVATIEERKGERPDCGCSSC